MLTKRERLLRTFRGIEIDRIAVSPFIWISFTNEFCNANMSATDEDLDEKLIEVYNYFDFDIMHRTCTIWDMFSQQFLDNKNWRVSIQEEKISNEKRKLITTIKTPEAELREIKEFQKVSKYDEISAETEHFIKSEEDFIQFIKYQPPVPQYDCSRIKRTRDMLGNDGITAPWVSGVFNTLSRLRKLDDLIMDAYTDPDFFRDMIDYFTQRQIKACIQVAEAGADVITIEGNIANGTMVGPRYFKENIMTYEYRIIKAIQAKGSFTLYHNCGDSNSMLSTYNLMGFDALESLTEKPFGDVDIDYAFSILDKNMTLIGNIDQIEFLKSASRDDIRGKVKSLLDRAKNRGRFILSTSDYISEGTPYENIKAFCEAGIEFGGHWNFF
jgi:uroporphyrinogen decarboxylase